ncbi:choice-of-anchor J domain-containing protein [candidate division WOR-3 bacterium]|nr:choice-of-anchor J domain-containing protein [candidate division WOR-3 bacterium]
MRRIIEVSIAVLMSIGVSLPLQAREERQISKGHSFLVPPPKVQVKPKVKEQVFLEDFETGGTGWTVTNGVWEIGTPTYGPSSAHNGSKCAGTNLGGYYPNNAYTRLVSPSVTLPSLSHPSSKIILEFYHWFYLESSYDYGYVQISTDGGSNWTTVGNSVNGHSGAWYPYSVDITSYAEQNVKIAFLLYSDGSYTYAGWYIDDVTITLQEPEPLDITINSISSSLFPFIYLTATVDTFDYPIPSLTQSNFSAYENSALQTDYFEVTPPDTGGGVRVVDIVFCMDNSGSMDDEQTDVRNNVEDFVDSLAASGSNFALGLVRFGASANSGYPIVEDNGQLTSDVNYFKNDVWARNVIDGWDEPGWDALVSGITEFSFRPGANKILILITDEDVTYHGNAGAYTQEQCLTILQQNSGIVFALLDTNYAPYAYEDYGTIAEQTQGAYFNITEPMDEILDAISEMVGGTYIVRYRSSNPKSEREVIVRVDYLGESDEDTVYYIPGSAPMIELTDETQNLLDSNLVAGSYIPITAYITDHVEPYLQSATLYYRKTGTAGYSSVSMYNISDSLYQGTIPGYSVETPGADFYLTATDGVSTTSMPTSEPAEHPLQIAVLPNEKPLITHTPVTELQEGQDINIAAEVVDNTYYVDFVKLFYRRTGEIDYTETPMNNTYGDTYQRTIPGAIVTEDGVDYYIYAKDDLGVGAYHGRPETPHQIEPEYDLVFRPDPDGWQFSNSLSNMWPESWWNQFDYTQSPYPAGWPYWPINAVSQDFPDWSLFVEAFGENRCYWNPPPGLIIYSPSAVAKWVNLKGHWKGSCFGFPIAAFLFFDKFLSLSAEFPGNINVYDVPIGDKSRKLVNLYWIYQFGKNQLAYIKTNKSKSPVQTLNECKQMFLSEIRDDKILVFFNQNGSGGHAVNPYKVEKDLINPNLEYIYVYDNRAPGIERKIVINTSLNTWGYSSMPNWGGNKELFLMDPVSNYMRLAVLPKKLPPKEQYISEATGYIEIYNTSNCNMSIIDSLNNRIGYVGDSLFSEFQDGMHIIPITGSEHPPIGYYLPIGFYSIQMTDYTDTTMYLSVFSDSTVFSYTQQNVVASQSENFIYENNECQFKIFNSDTQSKNFDLQSIIIESNNEKVFWIRDCIILQDDSLDFDIVEMRDFQVSNKGQSKNYDLQVRLAAENTDIIFEHKDIQILPFSSHKITPDWNDLKNQLMPILIDEDLDGDIDDTLLLENQYIGDTPPTGGRLDNKHVYAFRNPFNPNIEQTNIRFSLSKSAKVTLKITDVTGHLVTILKDNIFMEKGIEYSIPWNGKNDKGDVVANGVYFYKITTDKGEKAFGKIAVLR